MRKILFILGLLAAGVTGYAQDAKYLHGQVLGVVDHREKNYYSSATDSKIQFEKHTLPSNSDGFLEISGLMTDQLYELSKLGWEFVSAYVEDSPKRHVVHWIIRKKVS